MHCDLHGDDVGVDDDRLRPQRVSACATSHRTRALYLLIEISQVVMPRVYRRALPSLMQVHTHQCDAAAEQIALAHDGQCAVQYHCGYETHLSCMQGGDVCAGVHTYAHNAPR
jgi:hypothetical protein